MARRACAHLSADNLLHNLQVMRRAAPGTKLMAMLKANAYGHGLRSTASRLNAHVDCMGVASIGEALALREAGIHCPIVLMEGVFEIDEFPVAAREQLQLIFHNSQQLQWLQHTPCDQPLTAWLKIDTGMGRLGFDPQSAHQALRILLHSPNVRPPIHIVSHLACADEIHHPLNTHQITQFKQFIHSLPSVKTHLFSLCNSAAVFNFPDHHYDTVRPGLALYGASPLVGQSAQQLDLKPVMTLQTELIAIQPMRKNTALGYGARYTCPEDMPVGVIALGYGDGYPQDAPDGTPVMINNRLCPLVGRVSMDMMTVDLRACPNAVVGDPVTLWGKGLPVETIAQFTQRSAYELLAGIQHRVKFHWK